MSVIFFETRCEAAFAEFTLSEYRELSNQFSVGQDEHYMARKADLDICLNAFFIRKLSLWANPPPIVYKTFTTIQ